MRIFSFSLLLLALMMSVASAADPIKIGLLLPMTGSTASFGQMGLDALQIARKIQPEALGRPVELKLADSKSDKVDSANAISRLIEKEKVVAVIGEMMSGPTIAAGDYAERVKIPMISPTATNPIVTQGKKFVSRVCFIDTEQGQVGAKLAKDELKANTAAIIYDISLDHSVGIKSFFQKEFTKLGGKVVSETMFKTGDRDFTPQLSRIKAVNPDVIYAPLIFTECALIAKQAREMGVKAPILAADGVSAPELIELGGKDVEGVYFTTHFHEDRLDAPMSQKFLELFKKDTGKSLDAYAAQAADAYFVLLDAINRAGSTDSEKVREAILATKDFQGVTGKITMRSDGNASKAMVVNKVQDGKFTYVTTITP